VTCVNVLQYAVKRKFFKRKVKDEHYNHWLEFASDEYDEQLIEDVKRVLRVGLVFLPLPVFWALYDQQVIRRSTNSSMNFKQFSTALNLACWLKWQGSRWTFQATRMNGHMGSFIILPDQMQIICPLMVLVLVPLFDTIVYPCLNQCGKATALKRIGFGLLLCGLSFVGSGIVELNLEVSSTSAIVINSIWVNRTYNYTHNKPLFRQFTECGFILCEPMLLQPQLQRLCILARRMNHPHLSTMKNSIE